MPTEPIWQEDQREAAERDVRQWKAALFASVSKVRHEHELEGEAAHRLASALTKAVERRVGRDSICAHVPGVLSGDDAPMPILVLLGAGIATCARCAPSVIGRMGVEVDDGRCDLCDEPSTEFTPFATSAVGIAFHGDACTACFNDKIRPSCP
jgi:hypothetical protein